MPKNAAARKYRGQKQPKEVTIWDRIRFWFKRNEKLCFVFLLLAVSFSFAFTGPLMDFLDRLGGQSAELKIYGEPVYRPEIEEANSLIDSVNFFEVAVAQYSGSMDFGDFRMAGLKATDFLVLEKEADQLGIVVSDEELGRSIRQMYWVLRSFEDVKDRYPQVNAQRAVDGNVKSRYLELEKDNAWDQRDWVQLYDVYSGSGGRRASVQPRIFEKYLRRYMTVEKVVDDVRDGVQVTNDEVFNEFLRREELRKISFFELEPGEDVKKEIREGLTDEDLAKYFDENPNEFRNYSDRLRVDYLYVPISSFAEGIEVTEKEIQEEYDRVKEEKYRNELFADDTGDFSVSPAKEPVNEKAYKPLSAVRDELEDVISERIMMNKAREFCVALRHRVYPDGPGPEGAEKPDGVSFDVLVAEHDFIETGTSPLMSRWELKRDFADYQTTHLETLFKTLEANSKIPEEDRVELNLSTLALTTSDELGMVIYKNLRTLYREDTPTVDLMREKVEEKLVQKRGLDRIAEAAEVTVKALRAGEIDFEKAASEAAAKVHTSAFVKKNSGFIQLPVEEDEDTEKKDDKATDDAAADAAADDKPKTEIFRGSRVVKQEAFVIEKDGEVGEPVRDEAQGKFYIVRLDGRQKPEAKEFEGLEKTVRNELLQARRDEHFQTWRRELFERARVEVITYQPQEEATAATDPAGAPGE